MFNLAAVRCCGYKINYQENVKDLHKALEHCIFAFNMWKVNMQLNPFIIIYKRK